MPTQLTMAPTRSSPAPMTIARWNELVEASRTAATRLGSVGLSKGLTRLRKLSEVTSMPVTRAASREEKFAVRKTKISAPASCGPTREIALLIADPSPAYRTGTDVMSAVVSGATRRQRPNPKMIDAGRKSVKYASGGRYVPGLFGSSFHG